MTRIPIEADLAAQIASRITAFPVEAPETLRWLSRYVDEFDALPLYSGWTQTTNFLITGLLTLAFAIGLRRALRTLGGPTWGPLLVGAYAIGLLGAGIVVADPMNGYPPGTPDKRLIYSVHGVLHDLFSTLVFLGLPVACFVFGRWFAARGERGWVIYSAVTAVVFLGAFILSSAGFGQAEGLVDLAGLFQRVTLIAGFGWLTLLAVRFLRSPRER